MLIFDMCLSVAAKCWYLNTTRLENRKLLNTEYAEKYI